MNKWEKENDGVATLKRKQNNHIENVNKRHQELAEVVGDLLIRVEVSQRCCDSKRRSGLWWNHRRPAPASVHAANDDEFQKKVTKKLYRNFQRETKNGNIDETNEFLTEQKKTIQWRVSNWR